jgi:hypothetical protein
VLPKPTSTDVLLAPLKSAQALFITILVLRKSGLGVPSGKYGLGR